eukprot:10423050-Alexandrium_andersonii.AAC.1
MNHRRATLSTGSNAGMLALQGAQSATCNLPKAGGCRNRLNPQLAMQNAQHHFKRSELELRGPRSGLET